MSRISQPAALRRNAARWLSQLKTINANLNATKEQVARAQNKYRHPQVREALIKMFCGKCAYCESEVTVVAYGAIEHFFPKSAYVDLTFDWRNLLLSCDICNDGGHKGRKFPLGDNGKPLLIDPTDGVTNPADHLEFVWDPVAKLACVYGRDPRGISVETIFDLNGIRGRSELLARRSRHMKRLFALLRLAQTGDSEAMALLQESCGPNAEYSAFAQAHIRPQLP